MIVLHDALKKIVHSARGIDYVQGSEVAFFVECENCGQENCSKEEHDIGPNYAHDEDAIPAFVAYSDLTDISAIDYRRIVICLMRQVQELEDVERKLRKERDVLRTLTGTLKVRLTLSK